MKDKCIVKAPAKLNLHLQVGSKRTDGFHNILSIFQMVNFYDELIVSSLKTDNYCIINGNFNCLPKDNLIYKAWQVYCKKAGKKFGIKISVEKKIPVFAGLGGGSSNAASALRAMNNLFSCFTKKELLLLAAEVGSDVPFFLSDSTVAIVSGRGEKIEPIKKPKKKALVLVHPFINISTKDAYSWIDQDEGTRRPFIEKSRLLHTYNGSVNAFSSFVNDFSKTIEKRFIVYGKLKEQLASLGSCYTNITGSGSALYAIFESDKEAKIATDKMKREKYLIKYLNLLDKLPPAILK